MDYRAKVQSNGWNLMNQRLRKFALQIAGPIDFAINFAINAACPVLFLGIADTVPIFGIPSVAVFVVPMCFFVLFCATFFGFRNGVIQRNLGNGVGPWPSGESWMKRALLLGLSYAIVGQVIIWPILFAVHWLNPDQRWSTLQLSLVDGLASGVLGYLTQVHGIWRANACRFH